MSEEKGRVHACVPNQCCRTIVDGYLAEFCPTQDENVFAIMNYPAFYGTPGSIICPSISNDQSFYVQLLPIDCNGLMILSKHKIISEEFISFQDRIPEAQELFATRGAIAATIEVTKSVVGVAKSIKLSAINTHLELGTVRLRVLPRLRKCSGAVSGRSKLMMS